MNEDRIYIYGQMCDACGECMQVCPSEAISVEEGLARIDAEKCTLCSMCLKACRQQAIRFERSSREVAADGHRGVWVFVEHRSGFNLACLQVVSKGYELARQLGDRLTAVVAGNPTAEKAQIQNLFQDYGVDEVRILRCDRMSAYQPEDVAELLRGEISREKPRIVLFLGSHFGRELAPRVAAKLRTGLTADCTDLAINKDGKLVQVRPTYGGRILASILCQFSFPQMASVRQNIFEIVKRPDAKPPEVKEKKIEIESIERLKKVLRTLPLSRADTPIEEAEIIVCGGLGLGSKEGFGLLESLARKVGGVVAGTREVVDRGWLGFAQQIGQTGKTVRPRIYIGCGVSGAIHHMIGMKHSRDIIAINKNPRAPIFKIATIGIVGDLFEVLPPLIGQL